MGNNENNNGQTVYEQLQEFLNECIILGRGYKWIRNYLYCTTAGLWNNDVNSEYFNELISYHELFSKDSGLMEFVEWKVTSDTMDYLYHHGIGEDYKYITHKGEVYYHYMIMSHLTSEQKIQYFLENAIIPKP